MNIVARISDFRRGFGSVSRFIGCSPGGTTINWNTFSLNCDQFTVSCANTCQFLIQNLKFKILKFLKVLKMTTCFGQYGRDQMLKSSGELLLFYCCYIVTFWIKNWQVFAHKTVNGSQLSEECNRMLQYNITFNLTVTITYRNYEQWWHYIK
jgi:hypothetical protein